MSKDINTSVIRISNDLKKELESLKINTGGVELNGMTQIISHLLWHYKHYKNNNGNN